METSDDVDIFPKENKAPPNEKKNGRRSSTVCVELGKGTKRFLVVQSELRTALRKTRNVKAEIHRFTEESDRQGTMRTILSLAMNYAYNSWIEEKKVDLMPPLEKSTVDKFWSVLEVWRCSPEKAKKSTSPLSVKVGEFLEKTKMEVSCIPGEPSRFDLRQESSASIAVSMTEHISTNFYGRVRQHVKYLLANSLQRSLPLSKQRVPVVNKVLQEIFKKEEYLGTYSLHRVCSKVPPHEREPALSQVHRFIIRTRCVIHKLLLAAKEKKTEKDHSKSYGKVGLNYALKVCGHLALPYLRHLSRIAENVRKTQQSIVKKASELPKKARGPFIKEFFQKLGCLDAPKPFSLLPLFKFRSSFVHYGDTEFKILYGKESGTSEVESELLNLEYIPQYKSRKWKFHSFRTNGFAVQIKLVALQDKQPYSPNVDRLREAGYDFPPPKRKVDVSSSTRGVYRVKENRYDNKKVGKLDDYEIEVIDPGVRKVVAVRITQGSDSESAESIVKNSETWDLTNQEWLQVSGSSIPFHRDSNRRRQSKTYAHAVHSLRTCRKKTANLASFIDYSLKFASVLQSLRVELLHRQRKKARFVRDRITQSALAKLSDRIAFHGQGEKKRIVFFGDGNFRCKGWVCVPRKTLIHYIGCRCLLFVLDEYCSSCRCPGCPNGKMINIQKTMRKGDRMRSCSSDLPNSPSKCVFRTMKIDRDDSATVSMTLIASRALKAHSRPPQFCRRKFSEKTTS